MNPISQALHTPMRAFPDVSRCKKCDYFDVANAEVKEILLERVAAGKFTYAQWEDIVRCRCKGIEEATQRQSHLRVMESNLPHRDNPKTFEGFAQRAGTEMALHAAVDFSSFIGPRALLLMGPTGRGKTHLLEAIARVCLEKGATVRYEVVSSLLDRLRHTYSISSNEDLLDVVRWYQTMQLLVLDEMGMSKSSDWVIEKLTDLIDERLRLGKWMAIGTNLNHDEMAERVGHRLASRLFPRNEDLGEVQVVALTAGDYRRE